MRKRDPLAHIPKPSTGETPWPFKVLYRAIAFVSPLIWIVAASVKAVYGGYDATHLTDPGHKRIHIYDQLVGVLVLVVIWALFAYTYDFSLSVFMEAAVESPERAILFAQFTGWESFVILYTISIFLHFYDTRRAKIIESVNRHYKVW